MNAKASHSMKIRILTSILALLALVPASAQWKYDRIMRRNFWNDGVNIAGIRCADTASISLAGIYASYEAGDYRTISQSRDQWALGAQAKSVRHLQNYSMKGSFSFNNTEASEMSGSMFLDPGFFPVNVYEFTPGRKTFQTYSMDGGIAVELNSAWTIGTGLDFTARNVAKRKDLRYSTYRLDLGVSPSAVYSTENYKFGLALLYGRNTETISAEQTGTTAVAPFAFFDEGLALGNWQVWTGNGSRLKESGVNGLPVKQDHLGGALQFSTADGSIYADASFKWLRGSIGERQVIWYRYNGPQTDARLAYRHGNSAFRANLSWNRLDNRETVQDKVVEGGISIVHEYGSNLIYSSSAFNMGLEYDYTADDFSAIVSAGLSDSRQQSTPIYPYVYTRQLKGVRLGVQSYYRHRRMEYGLGIIWADATATDGSRTVAATGSSTVVATGSTTTPFRHDDVWSDACRFQVAGHLDPNISVSWNFSRKLYAVLRGNCSYSADYEKIRYNITTGLNYIF